MHYSLPPPLMSKKGKSFEKTIRLIQETLKDSDNTTIFSNQKLKTRTGRKREIDILLVTKINELEINIAIECKDYSKPVGTKEVEAFSSKCDILITPINKKVLVSSIGYQAGAIDSAQELKVDLLKTEQLTDEVIVNWMPIMQLGMEFLPPFENIVLYIDSNDEALIKETLQSFDSMIRFNAEPKEVHLGTLLANYVNSQKQFFWKWGLLEWMKLPDSKRDEPIGLSFQLGIQESYILDTNKDRINLNGLSTTIKVKFKQTPAIIKDARTLIDSKGIPKANAVQIDMGHNLTSDIVVDSNSKTEVFVTDKEGQTKKLQHLFTFNPKTLN
jgi:uncharacterized protein YqgV (UPF0045/DUF77 family)